MRYFVRQTPSIPIRVMICLSLVLMAEYPIIASLISMFCRDFDNDSFANAKEDSNGNGKYDPGVDHSDLEDGNSPLVTSDLILPGRLSSR